VISLFGLKSGAALATVAGELIEVPVTRKPRACASTGPVPAAKSCPVASSVDRARSLAYLPHCWAKDSLDLKQGRLGTSFLR
jgi:hypothetical protein